MKVWVVLVGRFVRAYWPVLAILVLALSLRLFWILHEVPVLQGDEAEYARLAENLVKRHGYLGMREGPQVMYPPFFPALIAAASVVVESYEVGGRLITVLGGLMLIVAVFAVGTEMYGRGIGLLAAALAACHPVLIALSGAMVSESVYLPLTLSGTYFGLRALESRGWGSAVSCGILFGLAYLTRPDGLFYPLVIAAALIMTYPIRGISAARATVTALLVLIPFVALASPYVAWLSIRCGGFRLEGKSVMNYTISERRNAGMTLPEATLGIGPDLREEGPWLSPNVFVIQAPYPVPFGAVARAWIASANRNKDEIFYDFVRAPTLGSLLAIGLVTLGLFRHTWSRRRWIREGILLTMTIGYLVILLGQHLVAFRYEMPLVSILLLWWAKGIDEASRWATLSVRQLVGSRWARAGTQVGVCAGLVLLIVLLATRGGGQLFRDESAIQLDLKDAGVWLAEYRSGPKRILGYEPAVSYYGGGIRLHFPVTNDAGLARDYVRMKRPDFLFLTGNTEVPAYYRDWFEHGVPDSAARLIYARGGRPGGRAVKIYEWTR